MVRGILLAVLATMAKQEAKRLSERVIAGMRKAKAKGTKSGLRSSASRVDAETEKAIQRLLKGGTGINKTAAPWALGPPLCSAFGLRGPFRGKRRRRVRRSK